MSGFLANYAAVTNAPEAAPQIMQSYGPNEANVINSLAKNFAVCDAWFASCPCQTWPNRGFVHTGSSDGHINNDDYELYDIPTIFNVLEDKGISWGIFHDCTLLPSLTFGQFLPRLAPYVDHVSDFDSFIHRCNATNGLKLPSYSFVEPRFMPEPGLFKINYPNDYHPPHNVCRGEQFLAQVYDAVRSSPYRDNILLVITFDEHGGCYDHVPPPAGAAQPFPGSVSRGDGSFKFDRYGVRVPTIVVSSFFRPGTVFRAKPGQPPYDHTSILATLRDWQGLDCNPHYPFLPSPRIENAPILQDILTQSEEDKIADWPVITATCQINGSDASTSIPLNDVQKSLIATARRIESAGTPLAAEQVSAIEAKSKSNYGDALDLLHPS
jgi:phospholipase C